MNKERIEYIEVLEEEMMEAWNNHYRNAFGGIGVALRIQGRCCYEADKKKILKKKRWDKECDKFIKKMKLDIRKYR